ncbi:hypothetical protein SLEP1_g14413 [Rubroshorea leprosula]|uniref:Uncharacterized protein n=1 Tax=Rubroshorea leprosula TaxID=152421 RepID=A0AAV5IPZ0_9ROSI|nr:hypothetical protein SLEP1_g14413 [Rubroshorea leprosula]
MLAPVHNESLDDFRHHSFTIAGFASEKKSYVTIKKENIIRGRGGGGSGEARVDVQVQVKAERQGWMCKCRWKWRGKGGGASGSKEVYKSNDEYRMSRREVCQIPTFPLCSPTSKKKKEPMYVKRDPPKNGFFQLPELEALFTIDFNGENLKILMGGKEKVA